MAGTELLGCTEMFRGHWLHCHVEGGDRLCCDAILRELGHEVRCSLRYLTAVRGTKPKVWIASSSIRRWDTSARVTTDVLPTRLPISTRWSKAVQAAVSGDCV